MRFKIKFIAILTLFIIVLSQSFVFSKTTDYLIIDFDKISRFSEDRIAYQRIEHKKDLMEDNSIEALLIIKDLKINLIVDGHDKLSTVKNLKYSYDVGRFYTDDIDFWKNKIDGKPDYIRISKRRINVLTTTDQKYVEEKFGVFYKNIRDKFIKKHVEKFRQLISNGGESMLTITTKQLAPEVYDRKADPANPKFAYSASAKANDQTVYFCEDADGDGFTETFSVHRGDGFNWGYKSGPNIIFIYKNKDKEIQEIIGTLAYESVHGTSTVTDKSSKDFPVEAEVEKMLEDITPLDKFYE